MRKEFARLALLQMVFIIYSILVVGLILKARFGSPAPDIFATNVRDWGFLLLLVPAAWCVWAVVEASKPASDHITGINLWMTGLAFTAPLAMVAFLATISALSYHSLLVVENPSPKPSIVVRQLPPDP